ncbi:hypothetical protein BDZ97DRAFT_1603120, partial [Flammula alnicola]
LVLWIAIYIKLIADMLAYVDDAYSWDFENNLLYYEPYATLMPAKQTRFLQLLDELGVPHDKEKQIWGSKITIIGFDVDCNVMTITMPDDAKSDLISAIRLFAVAGHRPRLLDYQRLAGWINWALNVYPLLRPGLSTLYAKISGKTQALREIYVNKQLCRELVWIADHLETSNGIFMMDSIDWPLHFADHILYTDACLFGMGFWSPSLCRAFQHDVQLSEKTTIFFYEAYTVLCALHWALRFIKPQPTRILICTDNMNTVNMFHSLRATPTYNPILLTAVDLLIRFNAQLRVSYVPGNQNVVADALSRFQNHVARAACPRIAILPFQPPRLSLG